MGSGAVAVVAKEPVVVWKLSFIGVFVVRISAARFPSVLTSASMNVIERQKLPCTLATTDAAVTVSVDHLISEPSKSSGAFKCVIAGVVQVPFPLTITDTRLAETQPKGRRLTPKHVSFSVVVLVYSLLWGKLFYRFVCVTARTNLEIDIIHRNERLDTHTTSTGVKWLSC